MKRKSTILEHPNRAYTGIVKQQIAKIHTLFLSVVKFLKKPCNPKQILIILIKLYQYTLSPILGPCCRFYPSCSTYAIEALKLHGISKGSWLTGKRLLRCHPWHAGGIDYVPAVDKPDK